MKSKAESAEKAIENCKVTGWQQATVVNMLPTVPEMAASTAEHVAYLQQQWLVYSNFTARQLLSIFEVNRFPIQTLELLEQHIEALLSAFTASQLVMLMAKPSAYANLEAVTSISNDFEEVINSRGDWGIQLAASSPNVPPAAGIREGCRGLGSLTALSDSKPSLLKMFNNKSVLSWI